LVESLVEMLQGDGRSCAWNSFQFVSRHWCCGRQATSRCVAHMETVSVSDVANDPMLPGVASKSRSGTPTIPDALANFGFRFWT
jgi:hypothetical protein